MANEVTGPYCAGIDMPGAANTPEIDPASVYRYDPVWRGYVFHNAHGTLQEARYQAQNYNAWYAMAWKHKQEQEAHGYYATGARAIELPGYKHWPTLSHEDRRVYHVTKDDAGYHTRPICLAETTEIAASLVTILNDREIDPDEQNETPQP